MKLPTQYIIITDDEDRVTPELNFAVAYFKQYADMSASCRVFKLEFDVETNDFETASEITADLIASLIEGVI